MNAGFLLLTFSYPINITSFDPSAITLHSAGSSPQYSYTLGPFLHNLYEYDNVMVYAFLSPFDLNEIKRMTGLCTSTADCFMAVTSSIAIGINGLITLSISEQTALPVLNFTADTVRPVLRAWSLDMNSGILILTFSETVDARTVQSSELTLQRDSLFNDGTPFHYLTDSSITSTSSGPVIEIHLSYSDLNDIKRSPDLGTSQWTSYLLMSEHFVSDTSGNRVVQVPSSGYRALRVDEFILATTPPELVSFTLNITFTFGEIGLTFSETVNIGTLNVSGVTLVNQHLTSSYTLISVSTHSQTNDPVVVFSLSQRDLDEINVIDNLATSYNNTYLTATSQTIHDMAYNQLEPISNSSRLQVTRFYDSGINCKFHKPCLHVALLKLLWNLVKLEACRHIVNRFS